MSGPSRARKIHITSRVPARLFASLRGQTQLRELDVKWGDFEDLSALTQMTELRRLRLGGAVRVRDLAPLTRLPRLHELELESLRDAHDLSPLAGCTHVRRLVLGGDWISPRNAHVDSIAFLRDMPQLEELFLYSIIVDDLDYSALLDLPNLNRLGVKAVRGMEPSMGELAAALPRLLTGD